MVPSCRSTVASAAERGELRLEPDDDLSIVDGSTLIGGSPLRVVRLSTTGAQRIARWFEGEPVAADAGEGTRTLVDRLLDTGMAHPTWLSARRSVEDSVTVVIPVKDDHAGLTATLDALDMFTVATIVIDDGSATPVTTDRAMVTVVSNPAPLGPAAARNRGLAAVETEFTALIDADVVPDSEWLAPLLAHFDDDDVVAVAPRVTSAPGTSLLERYERTASPLDLGTRPARVAPRSRVSYVPSACLVVRTEALRAIDGFDEQLRFGEDVDAIWRLLDAGARVRYEPAIEVMHRPRHSVVEMMRQRFGYGTAAAELDVRHPGFVAPIELSIWSMVAVLSVAAGHPVVAMGVTAASGVRLDQRAKLGLDRSIPIAVRGGAHAVERAAGELTRTWWPVTVLGMVASRRIRRHTLVATAAVVGLDWWRRGRHTRTDPIRWGALRLVDSASYGAGVWRGAVRRRRWRVLLPRLNATS